MDKHATAAIIEDAIESVRHAQSITTTARVIDLLVNINNRLCQLSDSLGLKCYVDDIRQRRIDPTM